MARIRSIKPEFWQDELVGTLPVHARLLFIGLWTIADDDGRFRANPRFVQAQVFPYDAAADVPAALAELERVGRIQLYEADGQAFGWVRKFKEHQRIDKPKPSSHPPPPPQDSSKTNPGLVQDESQMSPGRKGEEGSGRDQGVEGSTPPPIDPVSAPGGLSVPAVVAGAQPDRRDVPRMVTEPDTPPDEWTGEEFWRWAQWKRQEAAGLPAERLPDFRKLGVWWSSARMGHATNALQEAFLRFGDDPYWQGKTPPLPFGGFMSQWDRFVPAKKAARRAS